MSGLPVRAWVNQPSTLQPLHHRHGERVLAVIDSHGYNRCYTLAGDVVSFRAPAGCLSPGWESGTNAPCTVRA